MINSFGFLLVAALAAWADSAHQNIVDPVINTAKS
jgi:hypothetical protein